MLKMIMINGAPGSGKTTASDSIKNWLAQEMPELTVIQESLAAPLRAQLHQRHHEFEHMLFDYAAAKSAIYEGETGREYMIRIGSLLRSNNENYFCDALWMRVRKQLELSRDQLVIVDDLGFENELRYFPWAHVLYLPVRWWAAEDGGFPASHRYYAYGDQFDNDSRYCLQQDYSTVWASVQEWAHNRLFPLSRF